MFAVLQARYIFIYLLLLKVIFMILNQWYAVLPSTYVKKEQVVSAKRLGLNLAFFRTASGKIACIEEKCSHRGASLGIGVVKGECVACPFHALEFSPKGECTLAPSLGKETDQSLARFNVKAYSVKEAHGIIYLWYGEKSPSDALPFFEDEIPSRMIFSELADEWDAFYSRCIENQLDVIHLPFVHHNTIGRGNKTVVNGPKVIFEDDVLLTSAQNSLDEGQQPLAASECKINKTYLKFKFPNIWINHVSDKMKIFIFFAPVDHEKTILYIRFYSAVSKNIFGNYAMAFAGKYANKIIERQDKRVVVTQVPKKSELQCGENLFPGDSPIIQYRKIREQLKSNSDE